jgi:hypothetical protein
MSFQYVLVTSYCFSFFVRLPYLARTNISYAYIRRARADRARVYITLRTTVSLCATSKFACSHSFHSFHSFWPFLTAQTSFSAHFSPSADGRHSAGCQLMSQGEAAAPAQSCPCWQPAAPLPLRNAGDYAQEHPPTWLRPNPTKMKVTSLRIEFAIFSERASTLPWAGRRYQRRSDGSRRCSPSERGGWRST